jgi:hypothetical protein
LAATAPPLARATGPLRQPGLLRPKQDASRHHVPTPAHTRRCCSSSRACWRSFWWPSRGCTSTSRCNTCMPATPAYPMSSRCPTPTCGSCSCACLLAGPRRGGGGGDEGGTRGGKGVGGDEGARCGRGGAPSRGSCLAGACLYVRLRTWRRHAHHGWDQRSAARLLPSAGQQSAGMHWLSSGKALACAGWPVASAGWPPTLTPGMP